MSTSGEKTVSFAKVYSESDYGAKCSDESNKLRGDFEGIQNVASKISRSFLGDIAPEEKSMELAVMDSLDIDLSGELEDEFDRAMDFAKANRTGSQFSARNDKVIRIQPQNAIIAAFSTKSTPFFLLLDN